MKSAFIYIMTNKNNSTLYVGFTTQLAGRIWEHKQKVDPKSFTAQYNLDKVVYYERLESPSAGIEREKQLKAGSRAKKEALINESNPDWVDLYDQILEEEF